MGRTSNIRRLPRELREAIDQQLSEGCTIAEVVGAVRSLGAELSRSAVGRHKQRLDKILERSRRTREIAETLARSAGRGGSGELLRGNAELLHGILNAAVEAVEGGEKVSAKDAMMLAKTLSEIGRAAKTGVELERLEADAARAVVDVASVEQKETLALPDLSKMSREELMEWVRIVFSAGQASQPAQLPPSTQTIDIVKE